MTREPKVNIGFLGEILVDVIATPRAANGLVEIDNIEARLGGAPINAAVVASQFSDDVASYPICSIGNDWLGDFVYTELRKYPIKLEMVSRIANHNTSTAFYPLDINSEQMWSVYHRDADLEILDTSSATFLSKLDGLGFGSPTLANKQTSLQLEHAISCLDSSCIIGFDVNYRSAMWDTPKSYLDSISKWLHKVHALKFNLQEAELFTGIKRDPETALRKIEALDQQVVFLTLGEDGVMAKYNDDQIFIPTEPIVGNPVGAGDSFFAAMLTGLGLAKKLHMNKTTLSLIREIGNFANKCGGIANLHSGPCSLNVTENYLEAYNTSLKRWY